MENGAKLIEELLSVANVTNTSAYSDALDYDEQLSHYEAIVRMTIALNRVIGNHNELIKLYNELNGRFDGATFTVGTGDITTEKIVDGGITVAKLADEVITEIRKISGENVAQSEAFVRDSMRSNAGPMISFIDDDCKEAAYSLLYKQILEDPNNPGTMIIPYAFACPHLNLGEEGYMKWADLMEMYNAGADITCHTDKERNMSQFATEAEFEDMLKACMAEYKDWGVNDVIGYCYCQGQWKPEYMNIVKKYFKVGFTVDKGVNTIPIETYYMRRVEAFIKDPTDGSVVSEEDVLNHIETVVIPYINEVAATGGWLIIMTHAWYGSFSKSIMEYLLNYIQNIKKVPIVSIKDALAKIGNVIETGVFHKPLADSTEPYFVVDALGKAWVNQLDTGSEGMEGTVIPLNLVSGKTLCSTLRPANPVYTTSSDPYYVVCEPVDVTGCAKVLVSGYAYYDDSIDAPRDIYCFLDANGRVQDGWSYGATALWAEGGTSVYRHEVNVPAGAKSIVIAGYTSGKQVPGLVKMDSSNEDIRQLIGPLSSLKTTEKGSVVGAINELYSLLTGEVDPDHPGVTMTVVNAAIFEDATYGTDLRLSGTSGKPVGYTNADYPSRVSVYMSVDRSFDYYMFTCSARDGHGLYAFFKQDGSLSKVVAASETGGTTSLVQHRVEIPDDAYFFYVAGNLGINPDGFAVWGCNE